jgi:hypothetical protein
MRSDMDKVIVERPRIGSRFRSRKKGYRKYLTSIALEELPSNEPMLGRWKGRQRELNEHLGPMRRFLRSNVGRPWNKVHQDLCEHISFDNAVQAHVLLHLRAFVSLHVVVEDKATVFPKGTSKYRRKLDVNRMYVCPKSGILKIVQGHRPSQPKIRVPVDANMQYLLRVNSWWEIRLRSIPNIAGDLWDVWFEREVSRLAEKDCIESYGDKLFAISKRPLTPKETRELHRRIRQEKQRS